MWAKFSGIGEGPVLVPLPAAEFEDSCPLRDPAIAIYRELACTSATEDGILAFVHRYGLLGGYIAREVRILGGTHKLEPLSEWQRVIAWLNEAVRVWDMVREQDMKGLAEIIRWEGEKVHYKWSPTVLRLLGEDPADPHFASPPPQYVGQDLLSRQGRLAGAPAVSPGDLLQPAILFVLDVIGYDLFRENGPYPILGRRPGELRDGYRPRSLLGAAYLQFNNAMVGRAVPRQCRECDRWFDVAPGIGRVDREICSTACRSRAYRHKQAMARNLKAQGKTVKQIAKELGSEEGVVKGWIKGTREK
jgi:hypothetical protein